ncbi:MAG: restriction endonuclease subunit S [Bacteroidales bacterium]|nr:restriction endonuclease subunit S [Bacteroidales bacterium]
MKNKKYKDSGIPWIGMIPEDWEVCKVKHHYNFTTGFTPPSKNDQYYDENGIPWVTISELNGERYITRSTKGISKKYVEVFNPELVAKGSLLYSFKLSVGQVAITQIDLFTNEALAAFQDSDKICLEYLYYSSQYFIEKNANENIYGAKLLNQDLIKNAIILFPPLPTQQRIADFLDKKCAEIDELAALQETMIAELKRYKQSVITEAVTKGLDKNVKMKDSGEEWIGEIPSHWEMRAIKTMATLKSGSNITTNDIKEEKIGFPVYGGNGLRGYYSEYSDDGNYALIGRQGALCGNINYAHGKFWATDHCVVCYPKVEFELIWFGETLRTMNLNQYSLSSAQPGLSVERIKEKLMPVPPLSEQQAIADYLDEKCAEIDELIAIKQQKIEALKEYKKSVIFEYVTGKKEV